MCLILFRVISILEYQRKCALNQNYKKIKQTFVIITIHKERDLFVKANDRIINLNNVSNINILHDRNRIVFNLNYNIEIDTSYKTKYISDYVYWDSEDTQTMANNLHDLSKIKYFCDNFIDQVNDNGFININEISSIKFIDRKNRVIFNLSHPVTFKDFDGKDKITSEFVYVNCNDANQYNEYKNYVNEKLGEK